MNTIQSSLFSAAIAICVLCALLARYDTSQPRKRTRYFVIYLVVEAVAFALQWLILHPTAPAKSLWLGLMMGLSFLVAPCLWLFAREISEDETPAIRSLPARHFAIIAAGFALTLPLIQVAHAGPYFWNPDYVPSKLHSLFIHSTMLACVILFLCQVPFYLRECVRILARRTDHAKALFSNVEDKSLNALRVLVFAVVAKWFVGLLSALHCLTLGEDKGSGVVFAALEVSVTLWALFFVMRQSIVFSVDERKLVRDLFNEPARLDESAGRPASAVAKYARSALDGPTRMRIQRKLRDAMNGLQSFRDSRLTLRGLCQQIKENPHYVSQVINQDLDSDFYDFVNGHRIDCAKQALAVTPDKTVLEIALEVGFNSKSTFNTAFRRYTGMTPTEYRESLRTPVQVRLADGSFPSYPDG
jgi:AraC-like DNA-binding protein